jgi:multidrug transporter EmrE-like cation transporter
MARHLPLLLIALGGVTLTVGDLIMRRWVAAPGERLYYVAGVLVWFVGLNFLAQSLRHEPIAVASLMIVVFKVATLLAVTAVFYGERLSPMAAAGIVLGLVSVALMELGSPH